MGWGGCCDGFMGVGVLMGLSGCFDGSGWVL